MPLPFELEVKGDEELILHNTNPLFVPYALPLVHLQHLLNATNKKRKYINKEPTSVLDNNIIIKSSPSPPDSTSTLSSSHGGADTVGVAALIPKWPENQETTAGSLHIHHFHNQPEGGWENQDSGQDQAMLRWIMGDVEDPSMGFNKMLHGAHSEHDFNGGCGAVDQSFISGPATVTAPAPVIFPNHQNQIFSPLSETHLVPFDVKPNIFNNTPRYNSGSVEYNTSMHNPPFLETGSNSLKKIPFSHFQQQQQGINDQLYKAADLIQNGNNPMLAQGILARLNHQISPIGKPFERAAFYFKEALDLLIGSIINNLNPQVNRNVSPFSLIFKIGAYKSFSEVSPYVQFANFTCNQALLESLNGFDHIHIIDFDIGYGGQWSSLMQELALRNNGGVSSLKITAFASPLTHDQFELGLTRENLIHFANEINVGFEFEIVNIDVLASSTWSLPFSVSDNEVIAVNLPIHVLSNHQTQIPSVLRFVKSLNPKIVVSVDRGCDRTDLPFSNHLIHALQSYSNLLESLDAVNVNLDSLQKIERFLIQPTIEKIVLGRFLYLEKTRDWRSLFISAGFSPLMFSNFTESQAECLVKRTPVREFHVEKRQSLLVLCWQHRELVSASAWSC